jgi:hypothetical protein
MRAFEECRARRARAARRFCLGLLRDFAFLRTATIHPLPPPAPFSRAPGTTRIARHLFLRRRRPTRVRRGVPSRILPGLRPRSSWRAPARCACCARRCWLRRRTGSSSTVAARARASASWTLTPGRRRTVRARSARAQSHGARAHVALAAPSPRAGCSFAPLTAGHAFSREERKLRRARFASARADIDAHNARWCVRGGAPCARRAPRAARARHARALPAAAGTPARSSFGWARIRCVFRARAA